MLSERESELLVRIGPGTPMGSLFRRFWVPVVLSEEIPEPDCTPVAVRILCEDLIAFRDTDGKVGITSAYCAHRHAHLFWGRNEEGGLRCTYHGWKYDVTGACVDMPNEPPESNFKERVSITGYPAREYGGCVWAYMGPSHLMPAELPKLEWAEVPDSYRLSTKRLQESNWAQAVEGGIDSSHVSFLHSRVANSAGTNNGGPAPGNGGGAVQSAAVWSDKSPRFTVSPSPFGFMAAARRNASEDSFYWRVTPFMVPSYTIIPNTGAEGGSLTGHVWVPVDDEHVFTFSMTWNVNRPITAEERAVQLQGAGIHSEVDKDRTRWDLKLSKSYSPVRNIDNSYMIDREEQRKRTFTGIKGISEQDMSIQESMGTVVPRWEEHLGTTDRAIIEFRKLLLQMIRDLLEGNEPEQPHNPGAYLVRSAAFTISKESPWEEAASEHMTAQVAAI